MTFFPSFVPLWVSISFLMAICIPVYMIANLVRKGSITVQRGRINFSIVLGFYILYLIYVSIGSWNGWFDELSLPPKILKFTMFPLLAFLLLVVFNLPTYKTILAKLSLAALVRIHIFRLLGSYFLILGLFGALPLSIALIAGLGDMITALLSVFVAKALQHKSAFAKKLTWTWNTFGLLDIIVTSSMALYLTHQSMQTAAQGVEALASFPFSFIPAFAPATIIFLHLSVYRKLLVHDKS
jgi:hypothetical protein